MSQQGTLRLVKGKPDQPNQIKGSDLNITLEEWTIALEASDAAELTVKHYRWHLEKMLEWLAGRGCTRLDQVDEKLLREWAVSMKRDNDWAAATRKQAINAARNYFSWCREEKLIRDNPADILKLPQEKLKPQRTITETELARMLNICDQWPAGRRNAAIISLLFDSGLRAAELCRLRIEDVDLINREFHVRIKGGATVAGWFGRQTTEYLQQWMLIRIRIASPKVGTVFVGVGGLTPGKPMTPDGLRRVLRTIGERAGVPSVSTHAFRRGFAVAQSAAGISDNVLKDLGRWSTTQMIRRYTLAQQVRHLYQSTVDRASTRNHNA